MQRRAEQGLRDRRDARREADAEWHDRTAHIDAQTMTRNERAEAEHARGRQIAAELKRGQVVRFRCAGGGEHFGEFSYVSKKGGGVRVRRYLGASGVVSLPELVRFADLIDVVSERAARAPRRSGQAQTPGLFGGAA
jgi:hypothetical protein